MTTSSRRGASSAATPGGRVLVVSGDPDLVEHVDALLQESGGFTLVGSAADAEGALRNISVRRDVEAVLLDVSVARDLAPAIARRLGTVLVARRPSVDDYRIALASRAIDVLEVPLSPETLESALTDAAERTRSHEGPNGTLAVISAPKGGCGVTTVAVHLAHRTHEAGASICVVELGDPGGGVQTLLHSTWSKRPSLAEVLTDGQELSDDQLRAVAAPDGSTLGVLPGPMVHPGGVADPRALATLLWRLETLYDVVVVDAGGSPNAAVTSTMADRVLILVTPDWQCVAAARALLESGGDGKGVREPVVIVNRSARTDDIQPSTIASMLGCDASGIILPECFGDLQRGAHAGTPGRVQNAEWNKAIDVLSEELRVPARPRG